MHRYIFIGITFFLFIKAKISLYLKISIDTFILGVLGICFRVFSIERVAIEQRSDMLILVNKALQSWLAYEQPYHLYTMDQIPGSSYTLYLTYLPLKWIGYFPVHFFQIDLRYMNLAIETAIYAVVSLLMFKFFKEVSLKTLLLSLSGLSLYYLNGYFIYRIDSEIAIFNGILLFLFICSCADTPVPLFACLGLSLATNQLSLLSLPFWMLYSFVKFGFKKLCLSILLMASITSAILLPFVYSSPQAFKAGVWDHWEQLSTQSYQWAYQHILNMNLSILFYKYGQKCWLKYIQIGYCFLMFILFIRGKHYKNLATTWMFIALTVFGFLLFNIVVWTYLFQPPILMSLFAIFTIWKHPNPSTRHLNRITAI